MLKGLRHGDEPAVVRRLAVVGDVHAEDGLLEIALRAAVRLDVDAVACTGDVVDGRGSAERCCELLIEHGVWCVRGNHDRWLFTGTLRECAGATHVNDLTPRCRQFLESLPAVREIAIPDGVMLLCHGIGTADLEKITSYDSEYSLRMNRHLNEIRDGSRYRLMVNGHSHERMTLRVGDLVVINAGALCHPDDPGFMLLDFGDGTMRWYAVRESGVAVAETTQIF
jgi:predicted phosphodiesterase